MTTEGSGKRRVSEVDALRGAALLGICVVNVPFLAGVDIMVPSPEPLNRITEFLIALLFQGKFFVLFSFLFGWGFAVQLASAERTGRAFKSEFLRRMFGLFIIGIAHALLVFIGDILVLYSLLGVMLLPLRNRSSKQLLRIAARLVVLAFVGLALLAIMLSEPLEAEAAVSGYYGGFVDAFQQRLFEWPFGFAFVLLFNGPIAMAAFCAGLAAAKSDFFATDASSYAELKRRWLPLLIAAIVFNTGYALVIDARLGDGLFALFAFCGLAIGGPCLSALYLLGIVELCRRGRLRSSMPAGRMSLTAYIGEGVLAGLLFNGYGLGFYGQWGSFASFWVAIGIYAAVHGLSGLWLTWKRQGPLESVLRLITRGT